MTLQEILERCIADEKRCWTGGDGKAATFALDSVLDRFKVQAYRLTPTLPDNYARAERALIRAGFHDLGGEEWKPPLGAVPEDSKLAHPDDIAVDHFATAMKRKMAESRFKGRSGWDDETLCPTERLQAMLRDHIAKGDPVDVGNFAMMLFNRDAHTVATPIAHDTTKGA